MKQVIKWTTKRSRGVSLDQVIKELNIKLLGWVRYFMLAEAKQVLRELDGWIRRKLRCYRIKQLKRAHTKARVFIALGIPEWQAWIFAKSGKGFWRLSNTPQAAWAMNNKWFKEAGLKSLSEVYLNL